MQLTAQNVNRIFRACLFDTGEDTTGFVPAHGVRAYVGFHPKRLEEHKADILALLKQLPDSFQGKDGGMSFLEMCVDNQGNHWGEHPTMDELVCLGLATQQLAFRLPRERWYKLPQQMPYLVVVEPPISE